MPNRGLKESITSSDTLARLTAEEERHFYRLLVQADDFGRFDARPYVMRADGYKAMLDKVSEADVVDWTAALERVDLIRLYEAGGRPYGVFTTWDKHQRRRAERSRYPDPPSDEAPMQTVADICCQPLSSDSTCQQPLTDAAVTPSRTHVTPSHVTPSRTPAAAAAVEKPSQIEANHAAVFTAYESNIGLLTPIIGDKLRDLLVRAPPEWIIEAIGVAVEANVRKLRYVESIVERWLTEGKDNGRSPTNKRSRPKAGKGSTEPSPYMAVSHAVNA